MANNYRNKELLVVDIGSYSIKALVGKSGPKGITVKRAVTIPISANIYTNGDVQNYQELSSVLKDMVEIYDLRNYPVVFTFSSTTSFARVLEVPSVAPSELKNVIDYEMQQYLPADVSAYSTQFRMFTDGQSKTEGTVKVLAGTIPNIMAENLWNIANECELDPEALDMHPNALVKLLTVALELNGSGDIAEQNTAFIDIGHTLMDVSIFEKGEFQFNRRILIGGKNIDQRIQRVLGVTTEDARMEKHSSVDINQEVFDYSNESRLFNSLKSGVDEWVAEAEKVIKFYVSRKTGNKIDRCFLYGGGTGINGIDKYMTEHLGIPTETIQQLSGLIDESQSIAETATAVYSGATGIRHLDEYLNTGSEDELQVIDEETDFPEEDTTGIRHLDAYLKMGPGGSGKGNRLDQNSRLSEDKIPLFINAMGALLRREEHKK